MSAEVKIEKKNDFSLVKDTQLGEIIMNLLYQLTKGEDHTITKDTLKFDQNILKGIVDKLNIQKTKTTLFNEYSRYIYIKVNEPTKNTSSTNVEISMTRTDSAFLYLNFTIPPEFSSNINIKPIAVSISDDARIHIPEIDIKFIEVTRESSHGVKEYYYLVDLKKEGYVITGNQSVEVRNELASTLAYSNITFNDNIDTINTNIVKSVTLKTPPVIAFDDIPERNKLVRSNTVTHYEIISKNEYQNLEAVGAIDAKTIYSIPEDYQTPNPDRDKILTLKVNGSGIINLSSCVASYSKVLFNGETVETIPADLPGFIEVYDAVALSTYTASNNFGTIPGLVEFSGEIDGVNTTNTNFMFNNMTSLTTLSIQGFKSDVLDNVSNMFTKIPEIELLDLSNMKLADVSSMDNFINPSTTSTPSKLNTIIMNNLILPSTELEMFNNVIVNTPNLVDVFLLNVETYSISKLCISINTARNTPGFKVRVHVDSQLLVEGLTFENIEFIY